MCLTDAAFLHGERRSLLHRGWVLTAYGPQSSLKNPRVPL